MDEGKDTGVTCHILTAAWNRFGRNFHPCRVGEVGPLTTTGQPAASAAAVSPPVGGKRPAGNYDAPKTADRANGALDHADVGAGHRPGDLGKGFVTRRS